MLLDRYGVEMPVDDFLDRPTPDADIAFFPRRFQYHGERFDDRYAFVGPCRLPRDPDPAWLPPAPGARRCCLFRSVRYTTTCPEFYRSCVAAFAGSPWHVVLAVGERVDVADLAPLPDNIEVHRVVPQLDVLAAATVFLAHAGMGGLMEAMQAGVPVVTVPQTVEQESNAVRVERAGPRRAAGPGGLTATALRAAVDRVATEPGFAAQVAGVRRDIATAGGAIRAADVVEALLPARRVAEEAPVGLG